MTMPNETQDGLSEDPYMNAPEVMETETPVQSTEASETPTTETTTPAAKPATTPAAAPQSLTPEQIAQLAARTAASVQQPQAAQQPQMTPERAAELLRVFKVTPEFMNSLGFANHTPEQAKAFQTFADGVARHAITVAQAMAERLVEERFGGLTKEIGPYVQYIETARAEQTRTNFFAQNKDLEPYKDFVAVAANKVSGQHPDGRQKTDPEIFTEVATLVRGMLKNSGINLAQATAQPNTGQQGGVPRMAQLQGSGGSGGPSAKGNQNNPEADIYSNW